MKRMKRYVAVAAVATAALAATSGAASAAISPDPYLFSTSDSGSKVSRTALGTSNCSIGGLRGTLTGNANGASGSITAGTLGGCAGLITGGRILFPVTIDINRGVVTVGMANLITTVLGGSCLYAGTLTGTMANGGSVITVGSPAFRLVTRLSGLCDATLDLLIRIGIGARISW